MPRIPQYNGPQAELTALPNARQQVATPEGAFGMTQARQSAQLGQALSKTADAFQHEANLADQARIDDALNQVGETEFKLTYDKDSGYTNLRGRNAFERPEGKSLVDEYAGNFQSRIAELESGLSTDRQREVFRQKAASRLTNFRGRLMNHEGDQFRDYQLNVQEGMVANAARDIGAFYNDPKRIDDSLLTIESSVFTSAQLSGKSAEWITDQTRKLQSNALRLGAEAAMEQGNLPYAQAYLNKYKGQMDPDDLLIVRGKLDDQAGTALASLKATAILGNYEQVTNPSNISRAWNITTKTESSGKQFGDDGKPLTSKAGAVGIAQVMPGTGPEAAKLAGLKWDEHEYRNNPRYNEAIGRAYFDKQVKDFGGNLAQAWAAYNAGPGATRDALKRAQKEGGNWLSYLPQETQKYVAKNAEAYSAGGGKDEAPALEDLLGELRKDPILSANPKWMEKAESKLLKDYSETQRIRKDAEDNAANTARDMLEQGASLADIPTELMTEMGRANRELVKKAARDPAQSSDLSVYQMLASDPTKVRAMSDVEFNKLRFELSPTDFKHFANIRADKAGKDNAGALNLELVNSQLNQRLVSIGLDPQGKQPRVGAIRQHINDRVLQQQGSLGRKLTDSETLKLIDQEFLQTRAFKSSFMGVSGSAQTERMFGLEVSDLPKNVVAQIENEFKTRFGISDPSDTDILRVYYKRKVK